MSSIQRRDGIDGLGGRLREARTRRNIGLREIARRAGVSASLVSQIETGKSEPSLTTLYSLVTELGVPLNEIMFDAVAGGSRQGLESRTVTAATRRRIDVGDGVTWHRLSPEPDPEVDFLYVVYEPGSASTQGESLMRHSGREYGYVISGRLTVTLGFDEVELGPGDSITFDSSAPHRLANDGDEPVHGIWFVLGRHQSDPRASVRDS